ncbi:hypothetical protein [Actinomadura geliboluensis]|uniref:Superinfection immunity protein n=1 Tax=Actinomadura geliboluensis TaxID=882440 RepID=A0A5S4GA42_9ACTN|nr:hypothetical protein [Actinomadura geliboluensis]TMR29885.1 hypothetical protein ETD96_34780 [Actinomadura geliboluensis]
MAVLMDSIFFWLGLIALPAFLAVLPTLIALVRGADDIGYIILINAICCAIGFAWPIALIAAITWPRREVHVAPLCYQASPAPPDHHRGSHAYGQDLHG